MKLCIWPIYELRGYGWLSVPLTDQEGRMMLALLAHREISEKILTEILWPQVFYMPDCWADSMGDIMTLKGNTFFRGEVVKEITLSNPFFGLDRIQIGAYTKVEMGEKASDSRYYEGGPVVKLIF